MRPTVFFSCTGSGRWSPIVARHDHTLTAAGSRPDPLGLVLDRAHAALERLVLEERVQHDLVEGPAGEAQRVSARTP